MFIRMKSILMAAMLCAGLAAPALADGGTVSGTVRIDPSLATKLTPNSVLFIFAKGPDRPFPVAAMRQPTLTFPLKFTLDETMAMMPTYTLGDVTQVSVVARISHRGDAIAQSGDLQGSIGPVAVGSEGIEITIGEVVP